MWQAAYADGAWTASVGAIFNLNTGASRKTSGLTGQALVIATALQTYGAIVMEVGPKYFQLEGEPSATCWNAADLAELSAIPTSAFEVVETGAVNNGP
jgi:hypothetical protein